MTRRTSRNATRLTWRASGPDLWTLTDAKGTHYASLARREPDRKWVYGTFLPGYVKRIGEADTLQKGRKAVKAVFDEQTWQEFAYRVERANFALI